MHFDLVVIVSEGTRPANLMAMAAAVSDVPTSIGAISLVSGGERATAFAEAVAKSGVLSAVSRETFPNSQGPDISSAIQQALEFGRADKVMVADVDDALLPQAILDLAKLQPEMSGNLLFVGRLDKAESHWVEISSETIICFSRSNLDVSKVLSCSSLESLVNSIMLASTPSDDGGSKRVQSGSEDRELVRSQAKSYRIDDGEATILSVVVPTLDASSLRIAKLLDSLRSYTEVPYQVVLVDNGNSPQGFSAPVNTGIRAVRTDYIAVINDDVRVTPGWWGPLQKELDSGELVVFPRTSEVTRVDFSAWCFAFKTSNLETLSVGDDLFFDPNLRIWFQDSDLMLRLLDIDRPPKLVLGSLVSHGFSETLRSPDPILAAWIQKVVKEDEALFVAKWGSEALARIGFVNNL